MEWDKETVEIGSCLFRRLVVLGALGLSACGEQPVQKGEAALKDRLARKDLQDRQVPLGRVGPSSVL